MKHTYCRLENKIKIALLLFIQRLKNTKKIFKVPAGLVPAAS